MPTTTIIDTATAVSAITSRTNAAGDDVTDVTGEDLRLANIPYTEGALGGDAFIVSAASGMDVTVGSGAAKSDVFVVNGEASGQGTYVVRLDAATVTVTVPASDPAQARVDEVYLIVSDAPYDAGSVSLPRIGYRKGDAGGGNPGPDTSWKASALLARIAVGAAVSSITSANITDARDYSFVRPRAGVIETQAYATVPAGALACDGAAVSRTTYRRLFRAISTTWGVGNGTTTFNVPNLKGRTMTGIDPSDTDFDTVGEARGSKASGGLTDAGNSNLAVNTTAGTQNVAASDHHHSLPPTAVVVPVIWT